jgi:hypothetical protein
MISEVLLSFGPTMWWDILWCDLSGFRIGSNRGFKERGHCLSSTTKTLNPQKDKEINIPT